MSGPAPRAGAEPRSIDAGWVTLSADGRASVVPEFVMPALAPEGGRVEALARERWEYWWGSPVAVMWDPLTDVPGLRRLLLLSLMCELTESSNALLSEIRQLEDRYGLSPQARRKLYWRIAGVDVPSTAVGELGGGSVAGESRGGGVGLPAAGGKSDPRLRSIKGGKAAG